MFPLLFKLRKLKIQPNGNTAILKKLPYVAKNVLCSHEDVFQVIQKRNILQNCNENLFFSALTCHPVYVEVTWSFFNVL